MDPGNEGVGFIQTLQHFYYEKRDMDAVLELLDDQITWIGAGEQEIWYGKQQARQALFAEKQALSHSFKIHKDQYQAVSPQEGHFLVCGEFWAKPSDRDSAPQHCRITAHCIKTQNGMKLLHLHLSSPAQKQGDGEFDNPARQPDSRTMPILLNQTIEDLEEHNHMLEALASNVPCGVHKCKKDAFFTLLDMNDGFLALTGYTKEEIFEKFDNQYIFILHPDDREAALRTAQEQLQESKTVEFEYRIMRKDGAPLWILGRGRVTTEEDGNEAIYCVLLDISERKKEKEELRLSLERYQIIINQATDIIFEWDIKKDTLTFSSNWEKKFGYSGLDRDVKNQMPHSKNLHPDDISAFLKIMNDTGNGIPYSKAEFRIRHANGRYIWCRIRATTQFNLDGDPIKAVGVIIDIDAEKKQQQQLQAQAETDGLTGLLNKHAIQQKIDSYLRNCGEGGFHAMLMVDLDHFKAVNDRYGHLSGDTALSDTAGLLKKIFRASDLIGRIGGDEFLVFMPNANSKEIVLKKLQEVLQEFQRITLWEDKGIRISSSIGVALYPEHATDYLELYRCADRALYNVKNKGRCGYTIYDPSLTAVRLSGTNKSSAVREEIDSELGALDKTLDRYTFRMLNQAANIDLAINQILEIVGRAYDVSRVYIVERSADGCTCSASYEWCNNGIASEIDHFKDLSDKIKWVDFRPEFDQHGIYYCPDIEKLNQKWHALFKNKHVCSTLQYAMVEDGKIKGSIGFDECKKKRYLSLEQIDSFSLIAAVISTFLTKLRMKERLALLENQIAKGGAPL